MKSLGTANICGLMYQFVRNVFQLLPKEERNEEKRKLLGFIQYNTHETPQDYSKECPSHIQLYF